jgi:hypothetical protein
MKRLILASACGAAMLGMLGFQSSDEPPQEMPPGHPPVMPQGHPPIGQPTERPVPSPQDIASVDAVISAYYDVISGPKGEARDWDRFRSLFIDDARLITTRPGPEGIRAIKLTPEQFITASRRYFEGGGYFEREVYRRLDTYGTIAHALSTYESRRRDDAPDYYSRGINSIQVIRDGEGWRIATIMWDHERPDENPIPPEYSGADAGTEAESSR